MGTKFNRCPNCGRTPSSGLFGKNSFDVYECSKCGKCYCYRCGEGRCPDCASKDNRKIGMAY